MVRSDLMFLRGRITLSDWLFGKVTYAIGPIFFRTNALFGERFDSVAQKRAAVLVRCAFDHALVVVNKETAKIDKLAAVLDLEKLERPDQCVRGASADVSLIFDRRTFTSQINFGRQFRDAR